MVRWLIGIIIGAWILAFITTPSDERCIETVIRTKEGKLAFAAYEYFPTLGNVYFVDNWLFYKRVGNRLNGELVAIGAFGHVFML